MLGFDVGKGSTIITEARRTDDHAQERKPFTRTIELSKLVPVTVPWNLSGGLLRYYSNCPVQIDQQQSLITLLVSTTTSADTNGDSSALGPDVIALNSLELEFVNF